MRFPSQAGLEDLKALIATGDDGSGHHILWIAENGEVQLTRIDPKERANLIRQRIFMGKSVYVHDTLARGGGWVGPGAAADPSWMAEIHAILDYEWSQFEAAHPRG